jgi:hypothetical protein
VLFYLLFVCKCVLPPGNNPISVNKYIISYQSITSYIHGVLIGNMSLRYSFSFVVALVYDIQGERKLSVVCFGISGQYADN